jgi:hypothetical protein
MTHNHGKHTEHEKEPTSTNIPVEDTSYTAITITTVPIRLLMMLEEYEMH